MLTYTPNHIITLLVQVNPKQQYNGRSGGIPAKAYQRFNLYKTGMSVAQYKALVATHPAGGKGYAAADLAWDTAHGFISLTAPANVTETPAPAAAAETPAAAAETVAPAKGKRQRRKGK